MFQLKSVQWDSSHQYYFSRLSTTKLITSKLIWINTYCWCTPLPYSALFNELPLFTQHHFLNNHDWFQFLAQYIHTRSGEINLSRILLSWSMSTSHFLNLQLHCPPISTLLKALLRARTQPKTYNFAQFDIYFKKLDINPTNLLWLFPIKTRGLGSKHIQIVW